MMVRRRFAALLWVVLAAPVAAQVTFLRPYNEKENPNTPVRGHAVVGVSLMPRPGDQEQERLFVFTPSRKGQVLSIDVTTSNGRVQGDALVQLDGQGTGKWTELSLPKRFRRSDPEGLAVGVQPRDDVSGTFYIASWGQAPPGRLEDQQLWLYVNRGRAPQVLVYGKSGEGLACTPAPAGGSLRFNTICKLPASELPPNGQLTLVRRDGGNSLKQLVVLVR